MPKNQEIKENSLNKIQFDDIKIPEQWIELTSRNDQWVYYKPCAKISDLQSVIIKKKILKIHFHTPVALRDNGSAIFQK